MPRTLTVARVRVGAAGRPEDECRLEERLRALAEYEPGAWTLWEEA
ncbi:MAG: hypothetical protein H0W67_10480 [Gemmatimonadales bacterium]|nr:hypothetical protein [Gemmatimonadales bacterium]